MGRDFPPVQTGPGTHPASCTMSTESFPGVKCGRGVLLTTHPLLVPRSWKSRAIPLPTLWATTRPATGTLPLIFGGKSKWSSSLRSSLQPPVTSSPSLLGPHIPLSTLLSTTPICVLVFFPLSVAATSHLTCYYSYVQQNSQQYKNRWYRREQDPSHFGSTVFKCMLSKSTLCSFSPQQELCSELLQGGSSYCVNTNGIRS
jgi:hypothetical protein